MSQCELQPPCVPAGALKEPVFFLGTPPLQSTDGARYAYCRAFFEAMGFSRKALEELDTETCVFDNTIYTNGTQASVVMTRLGTPEVHRVLQDAQRLVGVAATAAQAQANIAAGEARVAAARADLAVADPAAAGQAGLVAVRAHVGAASAILEAAKADPAAALDDLAAADANLAAAQGILGDQAGITAARVHLGTAQDKITAAAATTAPGEIQDRIDEARASIAAAQQSAAAAVANIPGGPAAAQVPIAEPDRAAAAGAAADAAAIAGGVQGRQPLMDFEQAALPVCIAAANDEANSAEIAARRARDAHSGARVQAAAIGGATAARKPVHLAAANAMTAAASAAYKAATVHAQTARAFAARAKECAAEDGGVEAAVRAAEAQAAAIRAGSYCASAGAQATTARHVVAATQGIVRARVPPKSGRKGRGRRRDARANKDLADWQWLLQNQQGGAPAADQQGGAPAADQPGGAPAADQQGGAPAPDQPGGANRRRTRKPRTGAAAAAAAETANKHSESSKQQRKNRWRKELRWTRATDRSTDAAEEIEEVAHSAVQNTALLVGWLEAGDRGPIGAEILGSITRARGELQTAAQEAAGAKEELHDGLANPGPPQPFDRPVRTLREVAKTTRDAAAMLNAATGLFVHLFNQVQPEDEADWAEGDVEEVIQAAHRAADAADGAARAAHAICKKIRRRPKAPDPLDLPVPDDQVTEERRVRREARRQARRARRERVKEARRHLALERVRARKRFSELKEALTQPGADQEALWQEMRQVAYLLGVDPGVHDFLSAAYAPPPGGQRYETRSWLTANFRHQARYLDHKRWQEKMLRRKKKVRCRGRKQRGLERWQSRIPLGKTADLDELQYRLNYIALRLDEWLGHYHNQAYRKKRWHQCINRQRAMHRQAVELVAGAAPNQVAVCGFGNAAVNAGMIRGAKAPVKEFRDKLERYGKVVGIPEFRTSLYCSDCIRADVDNGGLEPMDQFNNTYRSKRCRHCHKARSCSCKPNSSHSTKSSSPSTQVWNRDVNAARNMLLLLEQELKGLPRPVILQQGAANAAEVLAAWVAEEDEEQQQQ